MAGHLMLSPTQPISGQPQHQVADADQPNMAGPVLLPGQHLSNLPAALCKTVMTKIQPDKLGVISFAKSYGVSSC